MGYEVIFYAVILVGSYNLQNSSTSPINAPNLSDCLFCKTEVETTGFLEIPLKGEWKIGKSSSNLKRTI